MCFFLKRLPRNTHFFFPGRPECFPEVLQEDVRGNVRGRPRKFGGFNDGAGQGQHATEDRSLLGTRASSLPRERLSGEKRRL